MRRTTTMSAAAVLLAVTAGACGSDDGASTYQVTRDGEEVTTRETRPPASTTPDTIVLPTFPTTDAPRTTTPTTTEPATTATTATTSTLPAADDVTVAETWVDGSADDGYAWGFTYEYTGTTPAEYAPVEVRFLDAEGATIDSVDMTIALLLPGPGAIGEFDYIDGDGTVDSIEVTVGAGDASSFEIAGELTIDEVSYDDALTAVSGQITSTYPDDLDDVEVNAVWRDASGDVTMIAGQTTRLVQADGVSWFVIELLNDVTTAPSEVYAVPRPRPYTFTPADPTLTITEQWYVPDASVGYAWGVILNADAETIWDGTLVTARFYDSAGNLVAADDAYQAYGQPGETALTARVWTAPAEIATMEAEIIDGGEPGEADTGTLTFSDLALVDAAGLPTVTATVTSTYAETLDYVGVVFVWRDATGAVVYATSTYSDEIPANGTAEVETPVYDSQAPPTPPTDVYWSR